MIALWRHPHHIIKVYQLRSTANDFNIILAFSHFQHSATPAETVHFNSVKYTQRWQRCSDAVSRVRDIIEVTSTYYSSVPHLLKCIILSKPRKKNGDKKHRAQWIYWRFIVASLSFLLETVFAVPTILFVLVWFDFMPSMCQKKYVKLKTREEKNEIVSNLLMTIYFQWSVVMEATKWTAVTAKRWLAVVPFVMG